MKNLSTISLFIFGVVVTAVLVAGLVFYQDTQNSQIIAGSQTGSSAQNTINQITSGGKTIVLSNKEIATHNKQSDCWLIISNKVYDITSYFGSHPGGSGVMAATCGTDATNAYMTKDPYATSSNGSNSGHSSSAHNLLNNYYIGDLNQTIGQQKVTQTNSSITQTSIPTPTTVSPVTNVIKNVTTTKVIAPSGNLTLDMKEIATHNKQTDCWMLISGKVYNITSFFGSHPGGNSTMITSCGKDATAAYMTKDPSATSSGTRSAHSSNAVSLLNNYYIGDFNQIIGQQKVTQTNTVVAPTTRGGNEYDD